MVPKLELLQDTVTGEEALIAQFSHFLLAGRVGGDFTKHKFVQCMRTIKKENEQHKLLS